MATVPYVELHAHSNHSLLDGVVFPAEIATHAADIGMHAVALTDNDGLYGIVPFIRAAEQAGVKAIVGSEMTLTDETRLLLLAETVQGYANLSTLITLSRREQEKGVSRLDPAWLPDHREGLIVLTGGRDGVLAHHILAGRPDLALDTARHLQEIFGHDHVFVELQHHYQRGDVYLLRDLDRMAHDLGLPTVATGNAHYLKPEQREVHDVLSCIRLHGSLDTTRDQRRTNDEFGFRMPEEMEALFADYPRALAATLAIAERCADGATFLKGGHQILPTYETPDGSVAQTYLRRLCEQAIRMRYSRKAPYRLLAKELKVIEMMDLANYFLIVADIVRFSRENGIRCQGRGSAANSLVAYLLNISPVDPISADLVFERFLSPERPSPPDIDIDFAADRREEVIQYVYERYGRDHAAMACTLVSYRSRSSVRDVSKALGFPQALVERLADSLDLRDERSIAENQAMIDNFGSDLASKPFQHLIRLAPLLEGIPRHLGIHNGGMILSGPPLSSLIPLEPATMEDRTVVQWDKYSLEEAEVIKIDILGLRMLSAIQDAVTITETLTGGKLDLDQLTPDDDAVYDMLCRGETIGVFQVESRAQANMIPNMQPRNLADLTVQISLIRPGPLQAGMVRPYLRRRRGTERVVYPHPLLRPALEETLGIVVYQEQVLKVARDLAGFTPGEGEKLRRALGDKHGMELIAALEDRFVSGAVAKGVSRRVAQEVFEQLRGFGSYSFAKSHAASFAVLTYQSAWLRKYHPAAFFTALLRHQPMGFYAPSVVVAEARRHGVEIRGVDIGRSDVRATVEVGADSPKTIQWDEEQRAPRRWDGMLELLDEEQPAIRLGLQSVKGLGEDIGATIVVARAQRPFGSLADMIQRTGLRRRATESLIFAGALDMWKRTRRQLVWELQAAFRGVKSGPDLGLQPRGEPVFTRLRETDRLWLEQQAAGVTAGAHITSLVGRQLRVMGATPVDELHALPNGTRVRVGGVVVARQRPPTAGGLTFLAIEGESGIVNATLPVEVVDAYRNAVMSRFLVVEGEVRRDGAAMSVTASRVLPLAVE